MKNLPHLSAVHSQNVGKNSDLPNFPPPNNSRKTRGRTESTRDHFTNTSAHPHPQRAERSKKQPRLPSRSCFFLQLYASVVLGGGREDLFLLPLALCIQQFSSDFSIPIRPTHPCLNGWKTDFYFSGLHEILLHPSPFSSLHRTHRTRGRPAVVVLRDAHTGTEDIEFNFSSDTCPPPPPHPCLNPFAFATISRVQSGKKMKTMSHPSWQDAARVGTGFT